MKQKRDNLYSKRYNNKEHDTDNGLVLGREGLEPVGVSLLTCLVSRPTGMWTLNNTFYKRAKSFSEDTVLMVLFRTKHVYFYIKLCHYYSIKN